MRWRTGLGWLMALALAGGGCDDDPGPNGGGPDAQPRDARVDRGADAMPDGMVDAMPDVMADAMPDAMRDMMADTMPDVMIDAMPDAAVDAMLDATLDAVVDAAVDAEPDAMIEPDMAVDMAVERCGHPRSTCRDDADCPGGACGPVPDDPGAPCTCIGPRPEPVRAFCEAGGPFESECCADAECAPPPDGRVVCQQSVYDALNAYCGGAAPPPENSCRFDECLLDDDCAAGEVCVPAGAFGHVLNTCRRTECRTDADCAARPGGECRAYFIRCVATSFGCSYDGDPCRTDADCPDGRFGPQHCVPAGGGTRCEEYIPPP